jgi:hypothetical protein
MRGRMPPRQKSLIKQTKSLQRRERSKCATTADVSRCSKLRVQRLGLLDQLVGAREQ